MVGVTGLGFRCESNPGVLRDDFNPVLLPNDAIACYDSHVTNVRDVIAMVSEVAAPAVNAAIIGGLAN